jgi:hypothetical protein
MEEREHPCPECKTGELHDTNSGGMFCSVIKCDNPECNYEETDISGCITS